MCSRTSESSWSNILIRADDNDDDDDDDDDDIKFSTLLLASNEI